MEFHVHNSLFTCSFYFLFLLSVFFCSVTVVLLHYGSFCHENKLIVCANIPGNKADSDTQYRAVAIIAIPCYWRSITTEECSNRGISVFFFVMLRPSHFTLCACVLNINDNNVYHADLYSGSVNLHLTSLNRPRMRERLTDLMQLPVSVLQAESCIFVKTGCHVQGKYIYIYAFSRCFYPKRLTVHSGYTFSLVCVFPGNRTHNLLRCWRNALPLSHTGMLFLL